MMIDIFKLDAFTDKLYTGNPAAVCLLDKWIEDTTMQNIASENNLAETAFIVKKENRFEIRWFTPAVEVDLCGHATLASAFILMNEYNFNDQTIHFYSERSGDLYVSKLDNGMFELDFPSDTIKECDLPISIQKGLNTLPRECFRGKTDYLLVYSSQTDVENLVPDLRTLSKADGRGVIVTAPGDKVDFVSRFFAPQSGIDEDPVTGSAHTTLTPYWATRLNKTKLEAAQLSKRGGKLICTHEKERVKIAGNVVLFLKGKIITK